MDFVSNKMALLLELNQQVVDKKIVRQKETCCVGHSPSKTKLRRTILKMVKAYSKSCKLYDEDQRLLENGLMKTPLLDLQKSGPQLQDTFIFDPIMCGLMTCPMCHHVSTQILECQLESNQAAHAASSIAGAMGDSMVCCTWMLLSCNSLLQPAEW